jgi:hypothetical protein
MGFYAAWEDSPFPAEVLKYKGTRSAPASLVHAVGEVALAAHQAKLNGEIKTHDELDAIVGLLNLLDFAKSQGDLFGTPEDGYFLVPGRSEPPSFRNLWAAARKEAAEKLLRPGA